MSAISQVWPNRSGSPDLAVVFAAVEAFPGSLAVVDSRVVLYANPAWARMFELVDPSQIQGRAVEDFIPRHLFHTPANGRSDSGGNCSIGELMHLRPDGRQVALMVKRKGWGQSAA